MKRQPFHFSIQGMHCHSCAGRIEKALLEKAGVAAARVNFATSTAWVEGTLAQRDVLATIESLGYRATVEKKEGDALSSLKTQVIWALLFSAPVIFTSMLMWHGKVITGIQLLCTVPVLWCGRSFFISAYTLAKRGAVNMDTLVSIGVLAAIGNSFLFLFRGADHTYFETAVAILSFVLLGRYLELRARGSAGEAIRQLMDLKPKRALRFTPTGQEDVPVEVLQLRDRILVRAGESVPTDGTVIEGGASFNESRLTGENLPVEKKAGDSVLGATLCLNGSVTLEVTRLGRETVLGQMLALVQEAQGSKAGLERLADRISRFFVPFVLVLSACTFLGWFFVSGDGLFSVSLAISVLVVACPCAMGLATPAALMVGTGRAAKLGILIRSAEGLEKAHALNVLVFDKTGTLTRGTPEVVAVQVLEGYTAEDLLPRVCALEKLSNHPLAGAVVRYCKMTKGHRVEGFRETPGVGVSGIVGGKKIFVGRPDEKEVFQVNGSPLVVRVEGKPALVLGVEDILDTSAPELLTLLKKMQIEPVLATGDSLEAAEWVGEALGIENRHARLLPQEKVALIEEFQDHGLCVGMVGDGVNDAAALALADVSFAMGTGTDIAKETSSITLVKGDLKKVVEAILLSHKTVRIIKQNLFWAFFYNVLALPLAALGYVHPMIGSFAMAMSSVSVVANALRLKKVSLSA